MLVRICHYCVNRLVKKCSACGAENRNEANYCLKCGRSVVIRPAHFVREAEAPSATQVLPIGRPDGCVYHPWLASQFNCSMCGVPICMSCVRYEYRSVYCPVCHARNFPPRLTVPFVRGPALLYQNYPYWRKILS